MNQVKETQSQLELMIQQQVVGRGIRDTRLIEALRSIPRERFFGEATASEAFADRASPIGHGQTISQPYIVALMTERLQLEPEQRVLEIGTGSGYHTAVLSKLAAQVFTIERVKPLLDDAFERLMDLGVRNVRFRYGDGTQGWEEFAPFDRILIAAGAPAVPQQLLRTHLIDGGIAVLPVGPEDHQTLVAVTRRGETFETAEITACRFVKLIGEAGWREE